MNLKSDGSSLFLGILCLMMGCSGPERTPHTLWTAESENERRRLPVELREVWAHGDVRDTLLQRPGPLVATPAGVALYDYGASRLYHFSHDGTLLWSHGRRGQGPDEYMHVRDVTLFGDTAIAMLDIENRRLTVIGLDGVVISRVPLGDMGSVQEVVGLTGNRLMFMTMDDDDVFLVVDADPGRTRRRGALRLSLPWDDYKRLDEIERQGMTVGGTRYWVFAFRLGNGWFAFSSVDSLGVYPFVEHVDFPFIMKERTPTGRTTRLMQGGCAACGASMQDDTLTVLFGGAGEERRAVLDRYLVTSGEYLGSIDLPARVSDATLIDDRLYTVKTSPIPELTAYVLEWRASGAGK